jgi:leucyl aminopeptidase
MGCLRVGQGSPHPPYMVILRHVPEKPSAETLVLVGKGITFDSGGISLKPCRPHVGDEGRHGRRGRGAVAMRALGRLRPALKVIGILCCAENLPDGNAQRPGDIFTAKNGKS